MTRNRIPILLACLAVVGCDHGPIGDPIIPLDQVPAAIMEKARKELPGYTFDTAYKMKEGYEIRGKNKQGKVREVEISATGEVLAIE